MKINLSELPKTIYDNLPISIKVLKNEYELSELPIHIQDRIQKNYKNNNNSITYNKGFDVYPELSHYSDLKIIDNVGDLIMERLRTHFLTLPNDYPFNCVIGSKIKYHLQTRDTSIRHSLIDSELENIIAVLTSDLNYNIEIIDKNINSKIIGNYTQFNLTIVVKINDTVRNFSFYL